jgi:hypothetical protein
MRNFFNNSILEHKSRPPLRWFANWFGSIASWSILKASWLDEDENYGIKYKIHGKIYKLTWPIYFKYGSFYKMNFDMSGPAWDDYDENGVPYWEKTGTLDPEYFHWDYVDEDTGDAFKVIKYGRP